MIHSKSNAHWSVNWFNLKLQKLVDSLQYDWLLLGNYL